MRTQRKWVWLVSGLLLWLGGVSAVAGQQGAARTRGARPVVDELELLGAGVFHGVTAPARWSARQWLALPLAAGVLATASLADAEARDLVLRNRSRGVHDFADVVEELGTIYNFAVLGAFLGGGVLAGDPRARDVAIEGVASSIIAAGLITPVLQLVVGRSRPWTGEDPHTLAAFSRNISFPSGHTTQAFAVASVIATEYEAFWVKATAYGLAGLVGWSRMVHDAHYLTDVAAAAAIGTLVGRSVARLGQRRRSTIVLRPAFTSHAPGVGLTVQF